MQSDNNNVVIASAGSGKTTFLVEEALSRSDKKIAIITYTNNNVDEIKRKFYEKHGRIPRRVDVWPWFTFLLHECVRPYQRSVYSKRRVRTISFTGGRSALYTPYSDTEGYYFRNGDEIYSDKISRFAIDCETNSSGLAIKRLGDIYDEVFIDEFQDLAGYDLDLLEILLRARIRVVVVGDPRQCTYSTNNSARNSRYRGIGVMELLRKWKAKGLCLLAEHAMSYRCNQKICDCADLLWPDMQRTESRNSEATGHDGVFVVSKNDIDEYVKTFSPAILRYSRRTRTFGYPAENFGDVKGKSFDRVLIVPHGPAKEYLKTGDRKAVARSVEKLYVAITRARYSVAFLHDGDCDSGSRYTHWQPPAE